MIRLWCSGESHAQALYHLRSSCGGLRSLDLDVPPWWAVADPLRGFCLLFPDSGLRSWNALVVCHEAALPLYQLARAGDIRRDAERLRLGILGAFAAQPCVLLLLLVAL